MNDFIFETTQTQEYDALKKQIRWALRRGMLELDRLLKKCFDEHFDQFNHQNKMIFIEFLEEEDLTLWGWIFTPEDSPTPTIYKEIVAQLRSISV